MLYKLPLFLIIYSKDTKTIKILAKKKNLNNKVAKKKILATPSK